MVPDGICRQAQRTRLQRRRCGGAIKQISRERRTLGRRVGERAHGRFLRGRSDGTCTPVQMCVSERSEGLEALRATTEAVSVGTGGTPVEGAQRREMVAGAGGSDGWQGP